MLRRAECGAVFPRRLAGDFGLKPKLLSARQRNHLAGFRALHCGEAEGEAAQIAARRVERLAVFLDRAEQLGHGTVKAVGKPASLQLGRGDALRGVQRHALPHEARPDAAQRAARADDGGAILLAKRGVGVEGERRLPAVKLRAGVGEERRARALAAGAGGGGEDPARAAVAEKGGGDVEPMIAKSARTRCGNSSNGVPQIQW